MYRRLVTVLMAVFVVLALPVHSGAVEETNMQTQDTATQTAESTVSEQKTRIEEYKTKQKKQLSTDEEKKVAGICKNSQQKLEKINTNIASILVKRQEKLDKIVNKLKALELKVQETAIDTTQINNAITTFEAKSTALSEGFAEYQLVLDDASTIDCETDPEGFKASLEAARAKRAEVRTMATEINDYIRDSVRPVLTQIKTSLAQSAVESER